ncbi:polyhydroxyalkanoate synthesis regulator DNA-binding domain-containing protein [Leptospira sp. GIMC2001]|uniref:polyhydroxyalkanoate synthesis regulator DNA-binding domain-containing protein n=1 Tax=Leptospira sp. GIMC2001 TaxID=1513297 RepID=UPI00234904A9|nr:polyhydroxyalkanoate synthesis regulator DNA-binding domain-containing protein [Leptospira sp. GIMC2001]WCL50560.1 polyhydroxyalkanoate biosynthesis repressor PhaR [Leptospira sp. GIMC2001]
MKVLKRYANRRLYDPETSKTITLEDVAAMILDGKEIRVVDNLSGNDITPKILGQTFLKVSLGQRNEDFSNFMLTALIRETGKDISALFERLVMGGIGAGYLNRERIDKIIQSMVELGNLKENDIGSYRDDLFRNLAVRASEKKDQVLRDLEKLSESLNESSETTSINEISDRIREVAERLKESKGS